MQTAWFDSSNEVLGMAPVPGAATGAGFGSGLGSAFELLSSRGTTNPPPFAGIGSTVGAGAGPGVEYDKYFVMMSSGSTGGGCSIGGCDNFRFNGFGFYDGCLRRTGSIDGPRLDGSIRIADIGHERQGCCHRVRDYWNGLSHRDHGVRLRLNCWNFWDCRLCGLGIVVVR